MLGYHREFWVEGPKVFSKLPEGIKRDQQDKGRLLIEKDDLIRFFDSDVKKNEKSSIFKEYYVFGLEAYIHSGVRLALLNRGNFCDRQWDVSNIGAVLVAKKEWPRRAKAEKAALGLINTWNDYLSGNVYGYTIENSAGELIDSCYGYYGDYDAEYGALSEARAAVDHMTNKGKTDHNGQYLMFN